MKPIFYFLAATYIQYALGDPVIRYTKPPKPLSMKDVQRYVTDTSKVLEELAKEHLWLLSRMTGTNNWKDLLGEGQEGVAGESQQPEEIGGSGERESPQAKEEGGGDERESPQPEEEGEGDERETPQPEEEGEGDERNSPQPEEEEEVDEKESPQPEEEKEGGERESMQPEEEGEGDERESPQPEEEGEGGDRESLQPGKEGEGDDENEDEGDVGLEEKQVVVEDETPQPVEVQTMTKVEKSSQAEDEALDKQNIDANIIDTIQTVLEEITKPTKEVMSHTPHSHPQNDHSHEKHPPQTTHRKPGLNPKIGYTTDIGHGNSPDPTLNYLAWKDKPIQHHVDPYGKPAKESDKLQKGLGVSKPIASVSPRVQNTQERDVVFSPLPINKSEVATAGKGKPIPNKTTAPVAEGAKTPERSNPLASLHNNYLVKLETLPKGIYNPLALDSPYANDAFNDIDNVIDHILAGTNAGSIVNHLQSDEPVKDPLDYPVQYYEPESLPSTTHSTPDHHHPAHHSRLEDYDIGW